MHAYVMYFSMAYPYMHDDICIHRKNHQYSMLNLKKHEFMKRERESVQYTVGMPG
jgi:hypothetical protein